MTEYIYTGPLSGVSLKGHGDVMLNPGGVVRLPGNHEYTARLIKRGWLAPAQKEQEPIPATETGADQSEPERKRRK